ncbi:precorrin-4 C(11)-methyltransferase [Bacteroides oleiciplenus]|uniref:Precorrin-4 C(11)-methyltransferase n=2 Tax=Bacteroides oleiciplenus TaxID=626931 RepID=A0A3E5B564_9BACE|nr:precorrin-4 C(11)-methyltransferase [Bacteroides oleiciplenus]
MNRNNESTPMQVAIMLISENSLPIARTLSNEFPDSEIITTTPAPDCTYVSSYEEFMALTFHRYDVFIFIGAMGICVRSIAPHVKDKHTDPAVICVDSTGRYAVSVLSGHIGKANEMTESIAHILGAEPVITTQSDRTGLWALDTLGDKYDWATIPGETEDGMMNNIISLFVKKVPTALFLEVRDAGTDYLEKTCPPHVDIHYGRFGDIELSEYELVILVTPFLHNTQETPALFFVPQVLHVGIGLAHQAGPVQDIIQKIFYRMIDNCIMPRAVKCIATINEKRDEPVIQELARAYQIHYYGADELKEVSVPNPSPVVEKHMGTPSVSEAAASLSANGGELLLYKLKGENYTMAIAIEKGVLRQGHIEIVGAGPGDPDLISVRGRQMLEKADLILYAGSLVPRELTFCAKPGATVRSSASMDLEEQFALMKEFYDRGEFVVRLHTGDPCIYGAIQEQMNYFDQHQMNYHITPGISSFQAAAAALKSQFTIPEKVQSIILTRGEGRTPMPEREQLHLLARSQSTMCIFLSAGIAQQVQEELLQVYPATTPVAVCYRLTWKDERIYRGDLKDLAAIVKENNLTLTTMIVVGDAIGNREGLSRLYAHEFKHLFRK